MDVIDYLQKHKVSFERLPHRTTYTGQELAAAEHVPGWNVAKPVIVNCDDVAVMCVLPACCRVDLDKVAKATGSRKATLATEQQMAEIFRDCELGAEPPLGKPYGLQTWMDEQLLKDEFLVFQAGKHTEAVKVARADYQQLAEARVASIARSP
jgi:Ala-tRNA(Pro) deacylase